MRGAIISSVVALVAGVALVGCSGSGNSPTPKGPTPKAPSATSAAARSLREFDFSAPALAADLINRAGGGDVPKERIRYLDLTGDGVEEAVVVVESGGTLGDIGVGVFRAAAPRPALAYFRKLGGRVDIRGSAIVLIEGVPAPGDPACCPAQLRETTIEWRGSAFDVTSERLIANPGAGQPGR
jgi:hypothetical protein